jgi:hypothetical protein
MAKNLAAKRRNLTKGEAPYEVWTGPGNWTFLVVKKNQAPDKEASNPYAIWNVACATPHETDLYGHDTYASEVKAHMELAWIDPTYQAQLLEQNPGKVATPGVENDVDGWKRYAP